MIPKQKRATAQLQPGTWFALPLPSSGYALGLIARRPASRIPKRIFCYFFGPRVRCLNDFKVPVVREPDERIFFARTNDRAFKENRWLVLDHIEPFDKNYWPMPPFRSGAVGGGPNYLRRRYLRTYDDDLRRCESEKLVVVESLQDYPQDISFGHLAMESAVDRVLLGTYQEH